jgi:hypothetical protein
MRQVLFLGGLGLALLLVCAEESQGQKKKTTKEEAAKATPEEYKGLQKLKEIEGKVGSADGGAGKLYMQLTVNGVVKEFEMVFADKAVIRKMMLGVEYDNEGNIITRTPAEIAKLKGNDPKVPGYPAKIDDLKSGQYVHLYFAKQPPKDKAEKPEESKEGVGNVARPIVRMVVILQEPSATTVPPRKKKN